MKTEQLLLFEEPKATPQDGLDASPMPEDLKAEYHPTTNRVVIEFTDAQAGELSRRLGLSTIEKTVYRMEDLLNG